MANDRSTPALELFDHTEELRVDLEWLKKMAALAMPHCLEAKGTEKPVLPELEVVEVSLISDEEIARVHGEFMDDPTATDVITFHHGEVLVSIDTAERVGPEHQHTTVVEALLYVIHGFLHLNGHTDSSEPER
ncbi:MAG: rRNA maturation RNase YbeY, partial [Verrucomicrobiota bacterium]